MASASAPNVPERQVSTILSVPANTSISVIKPANNTVVTLTPNATVPPPAPTAPPTAPPSAPPSAPPTAPSAPRIALAVPSASIAPIAPASEEKKVRKLVRSSATVPAATAAAPPATAPPATAAKPVKEKKQKVFDTINEWGHHRAEEKKIEERKRNANKKIPYEDKGDYIFTPEGDAKVTETQSIPIIPQVRAPSASIQKYFVDKLESLKDLEMNFATKKRELQAVVESYRRGESSVDAVMLMNQNVAEADAILNAKAKLPRRVNVIQGLEREIYLDKPLEKRKLADPVGVAVYTTFPYGAFLAQVVPEEEDIDSLGAIPQGAIPQGAIPQGAPESLSEEQKTFQRRGAIIAAQRAKNRL